MPNKNTEKSNGAMKKPVHPVADQFADSLHSTVDSIHGTAASTEETLRAKSTQSSEAMKAQTRLLRSKWNQSPVKKYAHENPVKTAGIAFTAGMLLTMFLRKK
ncbi:DUF883 C-terminal domain-containing protein [Colwellia sp. D2M02]|uniref:DUF883 domain-containing protein n=1 Tax=Colwellia asteriadis TaxID=517723 RepID=A0ABN1L725_9GAMM|nr:DUF883 C-terminal domain-containing protein [Colwellia sp. D2M02]MBU2892288.1 DUF883 C-terminal domain-containing protein [Colwellia sp. D2M02]